jgi:hypothetical protein
VNSRHIEQLIIIVWILFAIIAAPLLSQNYLSGRVYEGDKLTEPPVARALSGVTLLLYGSNNAGNLGIPIDTATTNSEGWYGLEAKAGYEYYTIEENDPSGYHSVWSSTTDGVVLTYNRIRYSTASEPLSSQILTGNKFWDKPDTPTNNPPVADANGPYTGTVGQAITLDGSGSWDPDAGDSIVNWEWDTDGDGQYDDMAGETVQVTWNSPFSGTIGLRVTDTHSASDIAEAIVTITEGGGQTGTLIIEKQTIPPGASDMFIFTGDINATLTDGAWASVSALQPGVYVVQESILPGWDLVSIHVDDLNSQVDLQSRTVTFHLEEGETIKATFYNSRTDTVGADLGDAPDGTNHWGTIMTAYPSGGPPGIAAQFPTVFDPTTGAVQGPRHGDPRAQAWLGTNVTLEADADLLSDEDGITNIDPASDLPNRDGSDDGVQFPVPVSTLSPNVLTYSVTISPGAVGVEYFINVWFDWNRDGDWEDALTDATQNIIPEWAVQNQIVFLPMSGIYTLNSPQYLAWHPAGREDTPLWMRITLSEHPCPPEGDGRGPADGYLYGETEDYYILPHEDEGEWDFGDAPDPSYPTLLANNGARHRFDPDVFLGSLIDTEADGQPDPGAMGDDNIGSDDEDGVVFTSSLVPGTVATVTVTASTVGLLYGYIDFDQNGTWDLPADYVFSGQLLSPGPNVLGMNIPAGARPGPTYARFRFTENTVVFPDGPAPDGEVEDYIVEIAESPPDSLDFGDAPDIYKTSLSQQGPYHTVGEVRLGDSVDTENDGKPSVGAVGDDQANIDDEDCIVYPSDLLLSRGQQDTIHVKITNPGPNSWTVAVVGWIDFDGDGTFTMSHPEVIGASTVHMPPYSTVVEGFVFPVPANAVLDSTYARFRLWMNRYVHDFIPYPYWGSIYYGEVEDHLVFIQEVEGEFDFGDAPDPTYPTLLVSNGARHLAIPNFCLGSTIDTELDGMPTTGADGDNMIAQNDEDGVLMPSILVQGQTAVPVTVTASDTGVLNAWLDFNIDGDWADAGEHFIAAQPVIPGPNVFHLNVPAGAATGQSYARFRFSSIRNVSYDGYAPDGEVEDYAVAIEQPGTGSIVIVKDANPKDDTPFWITVVFGIHGGAAPYRDPSSNTATITNGPAGVYDMGESVPPGWTLTDIAVTGDTDNGSLVDVAQAKVQVDLDAGEHIMVVFKNEKSDEMEFDFGDAPPPYPTLHVAGGAYHSISTATYMGAVPDAETDGQPDPNALGDDNNNIDDEEGVMTAIGGNLFFNHSLTMGTDVKLGFWIDLDQDGIWANAPQDLGYSLQIHSTTSPVTVQLGLLTFNLQINPGVYFARWRCYEDPALTAIPTGYGGYGEVEDYRFVVTEDTTTSDYGDAPSPYPTRMQTAPMLCDGWRHPVTPGVYLGQSIDSEPDGQPDAAAMGDDNDGNDDEDGIVFVDPLMAGQVSTIHVMASVPGYLNGFIDFNQDGDWDDSGEQIYTEHSVTAGVNILSIPVPATAPSGHTFVRFRFSSEKLYMSVQQPNRYYARDGEVEDYRVRIYGEGEGLPLKWNQPPLHNPNPDFPFPRSFYGWDEPSLYGEFIMADDWICIDPRPVTGIQWWGSYLAWDSAAPPEIAPHSFHLGIWTDVPAGVDQDWSHPEVLIWEQIVPRTALNEHCVGSDFMPWRMDMPDSCFLYTYSIPEDNWFYQDADSTIYWLSIAAMYDSLPDPHVWGWKTREHYFHDDAVRIIEPKIVTIGTPVDFSEPIGEFWDLAYVLWTNEPYPIYFDYGDAPDFAYQTLFASNGAHHIVNSGRFGPIPILGGRVDWEIDGFPTTDAMGDDNDGTDDEDGVVFTAPLYGGDSVDVQVTVTGEGFLSAWVDFNGNGSWADPSEKIFHDEHLTTGTHMLKFLVPDTLAEGLRYARFRYGSEVRVPSFGLARDGEVEDYIVEIQTGVDDEEKGTETLPNAFRLYPNYPSPFNPMTTIRYDISRPVHVRLSVFNTAGQEIAVLVDRFQSAGSYSAVWQGRDDTGRSVAAGMYLYRLEAGEFRETRKLLYVK